MPFINIEKAKRNSVLKEKIDAENYLGLYNDRVRLTSLGVSLGLDRPIKIKSNEGLLRNDNVENNFFLKTIITCGTIYSLNDNDDLNEVLSNDYIYKHASECLNRGLDIIVDQIDSYPASNYRLKLIEELDDLYEEIVKD